MRTTANSPVKVSSRISTPFTIVMLLTSLLLLQRANAQTSGSLKNDVYVEAGGNGLFGSLNYERQLSKTPGVSLRMGVGFYTENRFFVTLPASVHFLLPLKKPNSFIDASAGVTWSRANGQLFKEDASSSPYHFVCLIPAVGYRKHTKNEMMWRISVAPTFNITNDAFVPWVGFAVGKRF